MSPRPHVYRVPGPHLYIYWAPALGVWVAQCEQLYTRPWTYASEKGWDQAVHQGLAHLYRHPRAKDGRAKDGTARISESAHSPGDAVTSTNGRVSNPKAGRYTCASKECGYAFEYDGKGTWLGPYYTDGSTSYPMAYTGWGLWDSHGDCARSILGAL